jgi:hypothetical protein
LISKKFNLIFYFCLQSHAPYSWDLNVEIALSPRHSISPKFSKSLSKWENWGVREGKIEWEKPRVATPTCKWGSGFVGPTVPNHQLPHQQRLTGWERWGIFFCPFYFSNFFIRTVQCSLVGNALLLLVRNIFVDLFYSIWMQSSLITIIFLKQS